MAQTSRHHDSEAERAGSPLALLPVAAIELDSHGVVLAANDLALVLFACVRDELVGHAIEPRLAVAELLGRDGEQASGRVVGRRANGVPVLVDAALRRTLVDGDRHALCILHELNFDSLANEAQRYFDVAFDHAPIGMGLWNPDGAAVRVNAAMCTLLGRSREELIGRRDAEFTHPDDRQADAENAWALLENPELSSFQTEKRFIRPDGSIVWALANLTFLRDDDGRPLSWVGQFQNITARKAAEEALRTSEERHRLVVHNLPGTGVVVYDHDLHVVLMEGRQINDRLRGEDVVGRPLREVVPPGLIGRLEPAARRALTGESSTLELVDPVSAEVSATAVVPHRDGDGEIAGVLVLLRDVTAERAAEHARRDAEERFRLAFDHAPIGLTLTGPDGRFLRVNERLCQMLGYDMQTLLTKSFQELTHPDDLQEDIDQVGRMLRGELASYEHEKRYLRADGSSLWILLSVSLVTEPDGTPRYFVSQMQDIEERRRAHGELEHLARHDPLTGCLNRRVWDEELPRAIADAYYGGRPLTIALLDLNEFKAVNDSLGHEAGDELLRAASRAWQAQLRGSDVLARLGGDEFAVLLPNCGAEWAEPVGRRLRHGLRHPPGCAVGMAVWEEGEDAAALMRRADRALYADKERDRAAATQRRSAASGRESA